MSIDLRLRTSPRSCRGHVPAERAAPRRRGRGHPARARRRARRLPPAARRPRRACAGRIVSVTPETAESATILVKPGRDWAGHVPGQYVRVGVDVDGVRLWRTYSLTHGPRRDRSISFTVKAIPGGVVSNHLVHRAQAGQMLQLEQAEGEFVLPQPIPRKLLLVTAGSGITPGDRDAAQPVLRAGCPPTPTSCCCTSTQTRVVRDLPRRAAGARHRRPPPAGRAVRRQPRHARRRPPRRARPRPGRAAHLRLRAGRPARRAREAPRRPRPLAHHRAVPPAPSSRPARAAPSPSPTAARSRPTAPPRSSTPPKAPASSCPAAAGWASAWAASSRMKSGAVRDLRNGALTVAVPGETGPEGVTIQTCISAAAGACHIDH